MIGGFFRVALEPFAGRPPLATELVWGVLTGLLLFAAFHGFTNAAAMRAWKRRRSAQMLCLYLFGDDPALSMRSLGQIAIANGALLLYALPPLLIAAPFVAVIAVNLNEFFTQTPLADRGGAILTVRLTQPCDATIHSPAWIEIDLPPVHIPAAREISWRLRATAQRDGLLEIACGGERVSKEIDARPAPRYFPKVRERNFGAWLFHSGESRLPAGPIERVAVSESLASSWFLWFVSIASLTAWLIRWGMP